MSDFDIMASIMLSIVIFLGLMSLYISHKEKNNKQN
jgi:Tfp pilus assembly protein PilW